MNYSKIYRDYCEAGEGVISRLRDAIEKFRFNPSDGNDLTITTIVFGETLVSKLKINPELTSNGFNGFVKTYWLKKDIEGKIKEEFELASLRFDEGGITEKGDDDKRNWEIDDCQWHFNQALNRLKTEVKRDGGMFQLNKRTA